MCRLSARGRPPLIPAKSPDSPLRPAASSDRVARACVGARAASTRQPFQPDSPSRSAFSHASPPHLWSTIPDQIHVSPGYLFTPTGFMTIKWRLNMYIHYLHSPRTPTLWHNDFIWLPSVKKLYMIAKCKKTILSHLVCYLVATFSVAIGSSSHEIELVYWWEQPHNSQLSVYTQIIKKTSQFKLHNCQFIPKL